MPNPRDTAIETLLDLARPGHDERIRLDAARELLYLHNVERDAPPEQPPREQTRDNPAVRFAEEMIRRWASK